ncbi:MAG: PAS domain-containing sensor histidine kinase [Calditrichales bacterium]|nr:MAG: PAS domain-containing sensor histidine kinase [Calditrichales bacterium]
MQKPTDLIQLFYEIAMSIGLTLDLNKMLKVGLTSYLKNLQCSMGAILHLESKSDSLQHFNKIYAIPRNIESNPTYQRVLTQLASAFDDDKLKTFRKKLPLIGGNTDTGFFHLLELPGFGLILLLKPDSELDSPIIKSISPLNAKLAVACNACLQNKELSFAHLRAVDINTELEKKTIALEESQKALRESEKKYRTIFENIQDVFFQIGMDGQIIEISPSISRYANSTREELIGFAIDSIYYQADDYPQLLHALKEKREIQDFEVRLKDRAGRNVYVSLNAHLVYDKSGESVAIEGSMRDVTVRKKAEQALRDNDRIKSDFVSSVSHELRTPLASILGFSSTILRDKNIDAGLRDEFINIIYQESQRLSKLIEDILNISRIESGRVTYRMHAFSLSPLIAEIIEVHRFQAEEIDVSLTSRFSEDDHEIFADPDAIKQVFTNLLGNAVKFTQAGGSVDCHLYREDQHLILDIQDTGIGIPKGEIDRIFEKFYRVYRPGLEIKGTGLGLSIVKEILEAHRIKIEIQSEENVGTLCRLVFPAKEEMKYHAE